jgi:hypothetical protein
MTTQEIGKKYVTLCQQGKTDECLDQLYSKNAVSIEAAPPPPGGGERLTKGLEAIRAKDKSWQASHTIHKAEVTGPFPHEDRFAVRFTFDTTDKSTGKRSTLDEVGLFTVEGDKITKEEFFYPTGD